MMPGIIQMALVDVNANSVQKMEFGELSLLQMASKVINFGRLLPYGHLPELRKFAQGNVFRFGRTYRCLHAFSSMKIVKNKLRSRLSESNLQNNMLLSVFVELPQTSKDDLKSVRVTCGRWTS